MSVLGKRSTTSFQRKMRLAKRKYVPPASSSMGSMVATRGFRPNYGQYNRNFNKYFPEKKVSDIAVATYQVNTTGVFTLLHNPALGSDYTNRIGRKTLVKSIYIRGRVLLEGSSPLGASSSNSQQARMIIFWDLQPNGLAPAVTDLLNTADPASQLNLNNRDRFRIVKDKVYVFDAFFYSGTYAAWNRAIHPVKCYKKLNSEVIFNGTNGGTIADINTGALYMFWIGSVAAGAAVDTNAIVSTRVRFDDQ